MAAKRQSIVLGLIRCGETTWQGEGRIQGAVDLPLSENGRRILMTDLHGAIKAQATVIYHPADEAATDTAGMYAQRIVARTRSAPELADPHLGLLEGLTEQEFADRFPTRHKQWQDDLLSLAPPQGEPLIEAAQRLFKGIARILRRSRTDELAIVLHPLGLGLVRCWLADRPLADIRLRLAEQARFERYLLALPMIEALEDASETAYAMS